MLSSACQTREVPPVYSLTISMTPLLVYVGILWSNQCAIASVSLFIALYPEIVLSNLELGAFLSVANPEMWQFWCLVPLLIWTLGAGVIVEVSSLPLCMLNPSVLIMPRVCFLIFGKPWFLVVSFLNCTLPFPPRVPRGAYLPTKLAATQKLAGLQLGKACAQSSGSSWSLPPPLEWSML